MDNLHVMILVGTRPEAVKMAPVIKTLKTAPKLEVTVCSTGQHKEMLHQALADFDIAPDINLEVMTHAQTLASLSASLFSSLDSLLEKRRPHWLLAQGDTTTVMVAALCAFYRRIKVGHVEAGLRSFNRFSPFPEEINRKIAALVADIHFAPTESAKNNLLNEGIQENNILVTGNTVVDALKTMLHHLKTEKSPLTPELKKFLSNGKKLILVTAHRRENLGAPIREIFTAIREISSMREDVQFIYPVHLNPEVRKPAHELLAHIPSILLVEPLDYKSLLLIMEASELILTDSGGVQEEGCVLRKPVLVMRDSTERMEGVNAGAAILVGADKEAIIANVNNLLDMPGKAASMSKAAGDLYGDGKAAQRIAQYFGEIVKA